MKAETCGCSGSKPNCIVITIETCCRKTCEKGVDKAIDVARVASGPIITEKTSADDVEAVASDPLIVERTDSGAVIISKSSDRVKKDRSKSAELVASRSDSQPLIIGEKTKSREQIDKQKRSRERIVEPQVVTTDSPQSKERRQFKLPLLAERHHGPGCAMEISVLEKHEDSCVYKKEGIEGRNNVDDRVGSYDCIGRLVFRTCNSNELDDDSVESKRSTGGQIRKTPSPRTSPRSNSSREANFRTAPSSASGPVRRTRSNKSADDEDFQSLLEPPATSKEYSQNQASNKRAKRRRSQNQQIMMLSATTSNQASFKSNEFELLDADSEKVIKKHYPGDGCKLHPPRNPFHPPRSPVVLGSNNLLKQVSESKKRFPIYTDEANQTDTTITSSDEQPKIKRFSQETITSLTDLSKTEGKRKSNFLGSLFRRSSSGRAESADVRKFKK